MVPARQRESVFVPRLQHLRGEEEKGGKGHAHRVGVVLRHPLFLLMAWVWISLLLVHRLLFPASYIQYSTPPPPFCYYYFRVLFLFTLRTISLSATLHLLVCLLVCSPTMETIWIVFHYSFFFLMLQ